MNSFSIQAQNLINNGDFEEFDDCPTVKNTPKNDFNLLKQWKSFNSIDYFNRCGDSALGVPKNIFGNSEPESGNGYVGLAMVDIDTGFFEQMYIELNNKLTKDSLYSLTFYIQITEYSLNLDNFECYFTKETPKKYRNYYYSLKDSFVYQIKIPNLISGKKKEWKKIQVIYKANGNENFFLIGMLKDQDINKQNLSTKLCSANKTTDKFTRRVVDFKSVYYFIDNIKLEKIR